MNEKTRNKIFAIVCIVLFALIFFVSFYSIGFLFGKVTLEDSEPVVFRNIFIEDSCNSTFHLDVKFTTKSPEFLVKEKMHIRATLKRLKENSTYILSQVYFALVTSEGHQMPFQGRMSIGEEMMKSDSEFYFIGYDTFLNFSSKFSCRLILTYYNPDYSHNITLALHEETIVVGPLIEVQPTLVGLQIRWMALQEETSNKTIGLAMIVVVLTLVIILIAWIDKYEKLLHKIDKIFSTTSKGKKKKEITKKSKEDVSKKKIKTWGKGRPDFTSPPPTYINKKEWVVHHWLVIFGIIIGVLSCLLTIYLFL